MKCVAVAEMNVQQLLRELACLHRAGEYSRACFACLLGDTDLALQLLEQGLAAGGWYSERVLREDEDLRPLQGLPAFERLVRASLDQQRNAQVRVEPILLVEKPSDEVKPPYPLLVALHGNPDGGLSTDLWHPCVPAGWLLALAIAGQPFWWGPGLRFWDDLELSEQEIRQHLSSLRRQYAIDEGRVVVGGFSRGGLVALRLAMRGGTGIGGFIAVGAALRQPDLGVLTALIPGARANGVRGYFVLGGQDQWLGGAQTLAAAMKEQGLPCEVELHPELGHEFPPDFDRSLVRALEFLQG